MGENIYGVEVVEVSLGVVFIFDLNLGIGKEGFGFQRVGLCYN